MLPGGGEMSLLESHYWNSARVKSKYSARYYASFVLMPLKFHQVHADGCLPFSSRAVCRGIGY